MRKVILLSVFLAVGTTGHAQSAFGIHLDLGSSSITSISDNQDIQFGFGDAEHDAKNTFYISPSIRYRAGLGNRFSLDGGIGYRALKNQLQLVSDHPFFAESTLNINLAYVTIPVASNYAIPISANSSLVTTAMVTSNFLVNQDDNFQEIIFEEINLGERDWYHDVVIAAGFSIAYQVKWNGGGISEWGLFVNRDINAFVKDDYLWGFYENLQTARNIQFGVQVRYFLP